MPIKAALLPCLLMAVLFAGWAGAASAAEPSAGRGPKVAVELLAPVTAIRPGEPFTVGLRQIITPHWHTYWKNPGDSGEATRLTWTLPAGFAASPIQWPFPEAIPVGPLLNYGYSDDVLLPLTMTPPERIDASSVTLEAKAEWLVCEKICIPEEATVRLTLPVAAKGQAIVPSAAASVFAAAARAQPIDAGFTARVARSGKDVTLDISAAALDRDRIVDARFFPEAWGIIEPAAPQTRTWTARGVSLAMKPGELGLPASGTVNGVLVLTEQLAGLEQVRNGIIVRAAVDGPTDRLAATVQPAPGPVGDAALGLWQAALLALLGGLILNLMPCVLPILSIKVLSIAGHGAAGEHAQARNGALAFLAGVLVSFALIASLIASLRSAGELMGWGMQFQSPLFVLGLAALFLAMALSMSGVFDVGGSIVGAGGGLASRGGQLGSFFTGVLATVAATPCTAPFMGAALGFALTRPLAEMMVVFLALGLGFALPVVALSLWGGARRLLPRPGPWMETLKQALAFPLYATVAWLVWVLSLQAGSDGVLGAAVVLTAVGFACWMIGQRGLNLTLRGAVAAAVCLLAAALVLPGLGTGAGPSAGAGSNGPQPSTTATAAASKDSEPFSVERVAELRSAGRPVFVNLTAAWCISCKVNEQVALNTAGFRAALRDHNIAYLKGDWTTRDDRITAVLRTYGRAGVPLYLLYPADPKAEAIILPQLLTETIVTGYFASLPQASKPRS